MMMKWKPKAIAICVILCIAAISASGCTPSRNADDVPPPSPPPSPDVGLDIPDAPEPAEMLRVTEVDLDDLLSRGLPVILYFGDDSRESVDTLDALEAVQEQLGADVLICAVDLAQNPEGREGFPIQVIPSQFFYMPDGTPIPLAMDIGIIMSTFLSIETEEPVFTIHEGPLSFEELLVILEFMGVVTIVRM